MIGIAIVTHGDFGSAMLQTAERILGQQSLVQAVTLPQELGREDLVHRLKEVLPKLDQGDGILILVDLFGGTPCNAALSVCLEDKREVLTGLSLPVLLEALLKRSQIPLKDLAHQLQAKGRESLVLASENLRRSL